MMSFACEIGFGAEASRNGPTCFWGHAFEVIVGANVWHLLHLGNTAGWQGEVALRESSHVGDSQLVVKSKGLGDCSRVRG
jgi:hypothetical protein